MNKLKNNIPITYVVEMCYDWISSVKFQVEKLYLGIMNKKIFFSELNKKNGHYLMNTINKIL